MESKGFTLLGLPTVTATIKTTGTYGEIAARLWDISPTTGEHTLVECYARSTLLTSWMMVLVGDPLYNPYAKTPKLKSRDMHPSPLGSNFGP